MNSARLIREVAVVLLATATGGVAAEFAAPDSLVLKDGRVVEGLIVRNTFDAVVLQEERHETRYPKSEILRIRDEADDEAILMDVTRRGTLPAWRVLANDFRTHDAIRSMMEIPATTVDVGEFRNVPYKSFRLNDNVELNIFGDPEKPAGLEMGIYGRQRTDEKLRKSLRGYLAGYLTTREEVGVLYDLPLSGGIGTAGDLTIEITPPDAPDAYGAWWISIYNRREINAIRLTDAEYARLTRPPEEVVDRDGRVIVGSWRDEELEKSERLEGQGDGVEVLARGFYRDEDGKFRVLGQ